jgi:hypothetical protein
MKCLSVFLTFLTLSFIASLLAGCQALPAETLTPPSPSTPLGKTLTPLAQFDPTSTTPQPTLTPTQTATQTTTSTPEAVLSTDTSPGVYQGWQRYTNQKYGFSLAFPPDWESDLGMKEHFLRLNPQSDPTVQLFVGFKRTVEDTRIQRTGVPAGDLFPEGTVIILGQEISRDILIYEGKAKAVLYNRAIEIKVDGLVFTLSVDGVNEPYETLEISDEVQMMADLIVESFKLTGDTNTP